MTKVGFLQIASKAFNKFIFNNKKLTGTSGMLQREELFSEIWRILDRKFKLRRKKISTTKFPRS